MDLGLLLAGGGGLHVADLGVLARQGEEAGFDGLFVPESWRSGFVPVAAIAAATTRVTVGPYVLNAHARTPLAAGMAAVDLDQMAGGRLVLGVGSGNQVMNELGHDVPVVRPIAKMRDYVEVLRRVLRAPIGSRVDHAGAVHSISGWKPQAAPERSSVPILLAATAPKMMDLAADVADGIALGALQSVEFTAEIAGATRDRSPLGPDFSVHCAALVAVDEDGDVARGLARRALVDLFAVKPHPHYVRLLGLQGFAGLAERMLDRIASGSLEAAASEIPADVVDTLTIAGTPDECAAQVARFRGVVDNLVLVNVRTMQQVSDEDGVARPDARELVASYDDVFAVAGRVKEGATRVA